MIECTVEIQSLILNTKWFPWALFTVALVISEEALMTLKTTRPEYWNFRSIKSVRILPGVALDPLSSTWGSFSPTILLQGTWLWYNDGISASHMWNPEFDHWHNIYIYNLFYIWFQYKKIPFVVAFLLNLEFWCHLYSLCLGNTGRC